MPRGGPKKSKPPCPPPLLKQPPSQTTFSDWRIQIGGFRLDSDWRIQIGEDSDWSIQIGEDSDWRIQIGGFIYIDISYSQDSDYKKWG